MVEQNITIPKLQFGRSKDSMAMRLVGPTMLTGAEKTAALCTQESQPLRSDMGGSPSHVRRGWSNWCEIVTPSAREMGQRN